MSHVPGRALQRYPRPDQALEDRARGAWSWAAVAVTAVVRIDAEQAPWAIQHVGPRPPAVGGARQVGDRGGSPWPTGARSGRSCSGSSTTPRCWSRRSLQEDLVAWLTEVAPG